MLQVTKIITLNVPQTEVRPHTQDETHFKLPRTFKTFFDYLTQTIFHTDALLILR